MPLMTRTALAALRILATAAAAAPAATHAYQEPNAGLHSGAAQVTTPAPQKTPADEFRAALAAPGGVAKARQIYDEVRKTDKKTVIFAEEELNQFGYQVLQEGRTKDAIVIFQMNVDEYPTSANTYDSLSDAYLADGNNVEALKFAERTIEKLATDTQAPAELKQQVRESAEAKIKQLKKKE